MADLPIKVVLGQGGEFECARIFRFQDTTVVRDALMFVLEKANKSGKDLDQKYCLMDKDGRIFKNFKTLKQYGLQKEDIITLSKVPKNSRYRKSLQKDTVHESLAQWAAVNETQLAIALRPARIAIGLVGYIAGWLGLSLLLWGALLALVLWKMESLKIDDIIIKRWLEYKAKQERVYHEKYAIKGEKSAWLNLAIEQIWPFLSPLLVNSLATLLETQLRSYKPKSVDNLNITKLGFLSKAPKVELIKNPVNDNPNSYLIEMWLAHQALDTPTVLIVKCGPLNFTVMLKNIVLQGKLCLEFCLGDCSGLIEKIVVWFKHKPTMHFSLSALNCDLMGIPFLNDWINETIEKSLDDYLVWPHKLEIPMVTPTESSTPSMPTAEAAKNTKPSNINAEWVVVDSDNSDSDIASLDEDIKSDFVGASLKSVMESSFIGGAGSNSDKLRRRAKPQDPVQGQPGDALSSDIGQKRMPAGKVEDSDSSDSDGPLRTIRQLPGSIVRKLLDHDDPKDKKQKKLMRRQSTPVVPAQAQQQMPHSVTANLTEAQRRARNLPAAMLKDPALSASSDSVSLSGHHNKNTVFAARDVSNEAVPTAEGRMWTSSFGVDDMQQHLYGASDEKQNADSSAPNTSNTSNDSTNANTNTVTNTNTITTGHNETLAAGEAVDSGDKKSPRPHVMPKPSSAPSLPSLEAAATAAHPQPSPPPLPPLPPPEKQHATPHTATPPQGAPVQSQKQQLPTTHDGDDKEEKHNILHEIGDFFGRHKDKKPKPKENKDKEKDKSFFPF